MDNNIDFEKLDFPINKLKDLPLENQVNELINIIYENNKITQSIYDSFLKATNSNINMFNSLGDNMKNIIERVRETEDWKVAQQGLDEKLTDKTIEHANSIENINLIVNSLSDSVDSISEILNSFSERFSLIQEQINTLRDNY